MVTRAVALAQWAVELDSKNTDPMSALDAYTESVRHLRNILARLVHHGAHSEASQLATIHIKSPTKGRSPQRLERDKLQSKFPANIVRNQKYNVFTFLPIVFYEQSFNLYFFVAPSQFFPALRTGAVSLP